jgi:hypothetical protein
MIDLQEATRRDDMYTELNDILDKVSSMPIGSPITWIAIWDKIKDNLDYYDEEAEESYIKNPALTEKQVWDMLWEQEPEFSLEYGWENLWDDVMDWMTNNDILIPNEEEE